MRNGIGLALVMIGVMMADSENLLIPTLAVGLGVFILRRAICSR